MRPSDSSTTQIPKASHAQFAYQSRSAACTRNGVATAENGFAMRISARGRSRTSAWASCSRRQPSSTSEAVAPTASAVSSGVGA